ncbi:unnamed protein product [Cochlearia groenlandica]
MYRPSVADMLARYKTQLECIGQVWPIYFLLAISPSSCIGYSRPVHLLDMDSVIHIGHLLDRYLWSILHILSSSYVFDIMPLWVTISLNNKFVKLVQSSLRQL